MHVVIVVKLISHEQDVGFIAYTNGWKAYAPLQLLLQPDLPVFSVEKCIGTIY